ncbi:NUDIX hydrolase (plasmid) [Streptomyces sp. S1D4-20]|nr:NUDIX hydrolase [Streptomyces sp. S1D4-20]
MLGGGCDPGESPARAIARKLDEEAGLQAHDLTERGRRTTSPPAQQYSSPGLEAPQDGMLF